MSRFIVNYNKIVYSKVPGRLIPKSRIDIMEC